MMIKVGVMMIKVGVILIKMWMYYFLILFLFYYLFLFVWMFPYVLTSFFMRGKKGVYVLKLQERKLFIFLNMALVIAVRFTYSYWLMASYVLLYFIYFFMKKYKKNKENLIHENLTHEQHEVMRHYKEGVKEIQEVLKEKKSIRLYMNGSFLLVLKNFKKTAVIEYSFWNPYLIVEVTQENMAILDCFLKGQEDREWDATKDNLLVQHSYLDALEFYYERYFNINGLVY